MARVLIIDDEESICEMIKMLLESEGFDVETANDGEEGVACYCENPADVVITDIFMPKKDGIEIMLELQGAMNPIKFIVISGGGKAGVSMEDVFEAAKEFGAHYTFAKPFEGRELIAAVKDLASRAT
jgi:DNA-binding response OmpR family regulator